ncbi:MAG: hypothetical protein MR936_18735 [Eubacterium sp.]|nr:hypothetical protein [Eubacterium sp.]
MRVSQIDVYEGINNYHCTYGYAPSIQDLAIYIDADNMMQVRTWLKILQNENKVMCDGRRTLRTVDIRYVDERSDVDVYDIKLEMTKLQQKVYEYLVMYIQMNCFAPSKKEINAYLGNKEKSGHSTAILLQKLNCLGAIKLGPSCMHRTIHVIGLNARVVRNS